MIICNSIMLPGYINQGSNNKGEKRLETYALNIGTILERFYHRSNTIS